MLSSRDGRLWLDSGTEQTAFNENPPGVFTLPSARLAISDGVDLDHLGVSLAGAEITMDRIQPWHPTPSEIESLTGIYWSDELGVAYEIVPDGDGTEATVAIRRRKHADETFLPFTPWSFIRGNLDGGQRLDFQRDEAGAVSGFTLSNGRVRNLAFTRHE